MIRLLVFLGNPGREYARTRHNIGRMVLTEFETRFAPIWQEKFKGRHAQIPINGESVRLLQPETFMNASGESVRRLVDFYRIDSDAVLVIHDDLEIPFGTCTMKKGGGLGGHNGLRSIKSTLGTDGFHRCRMGIGRPARGSVSAHVLGRFNKAEEAELPAFLEKGYTELITYLEK